MASVEKNIPSTQTGVVRVTSGFAIQNGIPYGGWPSRGDWPEDSQLDCARRKEYSRPMNAHHSDLDDVSYLRFTDRQRIEKAFHTLEGLLNGIALDGKIEPLEQRELSEWCEEHGKFANRHPFNEIVPNIKTALSDGILTPEELKDLLWLCSNLKGENPYFDAVTADIQMLQGILHGVTADGKIEKEELTRLQGWISDNEHLSGCYPYDELNTVLSSVLKDGEIDQQEHEQLLQFFNSFVPVSVAKQVRQLSAKPLSKKELTLPGICAMCPTIEFPEHYFCLTGFSSKGRKSDFAKAVTELRGIYVDDVPKYLNYLVVGAMANPAWAFCCYGRKIEAAIELRKTGKRLFIVHENDFWDAAEDLKAGIT